MSEDQIVQKISALYNVVMSFRKDDDYEVNQEQMDKLCRLYRFFLDSAMQLDGEVDPLQAVPKEEHGGVTAKFLVFDVSGTRVQEFCNALSGCSAFGVEALEDGRIVIDATVPNVFKKKLN